MLTCRVMNHQGFYRWRLKTGGGGGCSSHKPPNRMVACWFVRWPKEITWKSSCLYLYPWSIGNLKYSEWESRTLLGSHFHMLGKAALLTGLLSCLPFKIPEFGSSYKHFLLFHFAIVSKYLILSYCCFGLLVERIV